MTRLISLRESDIFFSNCPDFVSGIVYQDLYFVCLVAHMFSLGQILSILLIKARNKKQDFQRSNRLCIILYLCFCSAGCGVQRTCLIRCIFGDKLTEIASGGATPGHHRDSHGTGQIEKYLQCLFYKYILMFEITRPRPGPSFISLKLLTKLPVRPC